MAQGEAFFQLSADGNSLRYMLIVANIQNVFMAHIHKGLATQIGPIIVWLFPSTTAGVTKLVTGRLDGVAVNGTITASDLGGSIAGQPLSALVSLIESGQTYVNVHTMQNPGGEIRGQIVVAGSSESTDI